MNNKKKVDNYSILIVAKYLQTEQDYINLICICKNYKKTLKKFRYNPIPVYSTKLFPYMQTQYLYSKTDKRIEEIVNQNSAPLNHNEQEIAGYRDVLKLIHERNEEMSLTEELVLNFHKILMQNVDNDNCGQYKKEDNIIRVTYSDGTSGIRWIPTSAKDTPKAMEQLYIAYMDARDDSTIDQLLLIPCVILDFLCIHPFRDGNGRISRLISLLLLYKNGFDISRYISFEEQINTMKNRYYESLKQSSIGWHDNTNDYIPFIENFIKF